MSPEIKRIAIAEACRWKYGDTTVTAFGAEVPLKGWSKDGKFFGHGQFPPDYLNNLNDMHAALISQSKQFRFRFEAIMDNYCAGADRLWCELEAHEFADIFLQVKHEGL